jgi:hypothetical protein
MRLSDDEVTLNATLHDPVAQTVRSQHVTIGDGGVRMWPIALRYAWPAELDLMAQLAGMRLRSRSGAWSGDPFTATSRFHVSVYER